MYGGRGGKQGCPGEEKASKDVQGEKAPISTVSTAVASLVGLSNLCCDSD